VSEISPAPLLWLLVLFCAIFVGLASARLHQSLAFRGVAPFV
jgi:hypothetical protein